MKEQEVLKKKFRVLHGVHYEGKNQYIRGSIVESRRDLDQIFSNKFFKVTVPQQETIEIEALQVDTEFKPVHRGGGRWDVINLSTNKKINEGPLKKREAEELAGSMS